MGCWFMHAASVSNFVTFVTFAVLSFTGTRRGVWIANVSTQAQRDAAAAKKKKPSSPKPDPEVKRLKDEARRQKALLDEAARKRKDAELAREKAEDARRAADKKLQAERNRVRELEDAVKAAAAGASATSDAKMAQKAAEESVAALANELRDLESAMASRDKTIDSAAAERVRRCCCPLSSPNPLLLHRPLLLVVICASAVGRNGLRKS